MFTLRVRHPPCARSVCVVWGLMWKHWQTTTVHGIQGSGSSETYIRVCRFWWQAQAPWRFDEKLVKKATQLVTEKGVGLGELAFGGAALGDDAQQLAALVQSLVHRKLHFRQPRTQGFIFVR